MTKITLIGLGAVGSVYANCLNNNPAVDLTIVVNEERKKRYSENPLFLNGEPVYFNYKTPEEVTENADYIIIITKYGQFLSALDEAASSVGEDTCFLSLLNGITSEELLIQRFGSENVLYGICNGIDATRRERSVKYSVLGTILFGEKENQTISPRVKKLADVFQASGLNCEIPEDMLRTLWYKFMVNVGVNQISAITGSPYGIIQDCQEAKELVRLAMLEVIAVAKMKNILLDEAMIDDWFASVLAPLTPGGKTSMLQDIEQHRPTEVALFSETVNRLGKELGIETPINEILYLMIRTLEYRNKTLY